MTHLLSIPPAPPKRETKSKREVPREEPRGFDGFPGQVFKIELDPRKWGMWVPLGLAVAAGYILTRPSFNTRHISWQEFRINYLEKGEVERLEVVNKNVVRVFLRRDAGGGVGVRQLH